MEEGYFDDAAHEGDEEEEEPAENGAAGEDEQGDDGEVCILSRRVAARVCSSRPRFV